ncbi:MAG TPA: cation:proton antiporter [Solirubrobacteraceae bacterium]|nr:cation:proton antiporter [Solirubrobacteraceae bacterium]
MDAVSFLWIIVSAAVAAVAATALSPRLMVPVVVFELVLGIIIGPQLLGLAQPDRFIEFFAKVGLGMLFFFAGYEIDFRRIRGSPLRLATWGWLLSLILAYSIGGLLALAGVVVSLVYTGSAMATTAIGILIPILSDVGEMRSRFGTYLLGAGAIGEFGPLLLISLVFSAEGSLRSAVILVAFVTVAVAAALAAVRSLPLGWHALERTLESSSQAAVRLTVVLIFALVALALKLGLDLLLGGFAAGIVVRLALRGREVTVFESKLTAIGYGFLIPFFFIVSGMQFDLNALTGSATAMLKLPLFVALFLVVRGVPALVLYHRVLDARARLALGFFSSTQLALVVAITTIAIATGKMRPSTAAALIGAGIISTLVFPLVGLRLRAGRAATDIEDHSNVTAGLEMPIVDPTTPPELGEVHP